jgi:segregation and condensation protein B
VIARLAPVEQDDEVLEANALEAERIAEALLFAAPEPLEEQQIAERLPPGVAVAEVLESLRAQYAGRGVNLVRVARKWTFRTAVDLAWLLSKQAEDQKKLSKPALETLAIIAYHQPVTRSEIEDVRGVAISKGTLDLLLETGWVRLRGRRRAPGRPVTYGTTDAFLLHFGLEQISDLPGLEELRAAGLFDGRLPPGFGVPMPKDDPALAEDEDPLDDGAADAAGSETPEIGGEAPAFETVDRATSPEAAAQESESQAAQQADEDAESEEVPVGAADEGRHSEIDDIVDDTPHAAGEDDD